MSKYDPLWRAVRDRGGETVSMTFAEIERILGFPPDHALLTFKKELPAYGYIVRKISLKNACVTFARKP